MKNQEDELELEGCGHQECGRFDPSGETCLLQEPITSCPDYDYDLGLYVHVAGCGCARREWE